MIKFLVTGRLETIDDLIGYCYHVAGKVGSEMLNGIVKSKDGVILDAYDANQYGELLQSVNIMANAHQDYHEDRAYIPSEMRPDGISHDILMNGPFATQARASVLEKMLQFAEKNKKPASDYIKGIAPRLSGYVAFCLAPYITGLKTLEAIRNAGAEEVFNGNKAATTLKGGSMSLMNILHFSHDLARKGDVRLTREWLEKFSANSSAFSFEPASYGAWAPQVLGAAA